MEITTEGNATGRPLINVGVVGKTIKMRVRSSATQDEIDDLIVMLLDKYGIDDYATVIQSDTEVVICAKPICPFCDMDFGYQTYLYQHLQSERCDSS